MSQYQYSRLVNSDSTRLLRLQPHLNGSETPIQCELFEYSLQGSTRGTHLYEALSYTWGGAKRSRLILINKQEMGVTENLYQALLRLQDHALERVLWIDALCINQEDPIERGQQVGIMAKIYSNAARVLVWLGVSADDSDMALEALRDSAATQSSRDMERSPIQAAIASLVQRPWFRRIWEVAAARHIHVICGKAEIDGHVFCQGIDRFYAAHRDKQNAILSINYLISGALFRAKSPKIWSNRATLDILPLNELIDMFCDHEATILADKVFALLGMSSDDLSTAGLSPDYTISWEIIFQRLAKSLLSQAVSTEMFNEGGVVVIRSKGCVLGQVGSVQADGRTIITSLRNNQANDTFFKNVQNVWTLPASARTVRKDDIFCLLEGAQVPVIIRPCRDCFTIVRITVAVGGQIKSQQGVEWTKDMTSITDFPQNFLLTWSWEEAARKGQEPRDYEYENLIQKSTVQLKADSKQPWDAAKRIWDVAMTLDDVQDFEKAEKWLQDAIKGYETAFGLVSLKMRESSNGRTPLSWAAGNGFGTVVDQLILKDHLNPNLEDKKSGRTPLSWAAQYGHERVVELLLRHGADVNSRDLERRRPLSYASEKGHCEVVKLLIENKAEVNCIDIHEQSPLGYAARQGHTETVKLLLESQANVKSKDAQYHTPLSWAASCGHAAVVKLLLEHHAEVDSHSFLLAIKNGHDAVATLFLQTGKLNDEADTELKLGTTPLFWAAENGYAKFVKVLLETGNVEVDRRDSQDRTPLAWACRNGHENIVEQLLQTNKVDINSEDLYHRTPLAWAARNSHEGVVKLLLQNKKVKPDTKDREGRTPLAYASVNGNEAILKMLLETGKVKADSQDRLGETPLSLATQNGHNAAIRLLTTHLK